MKFDEIKAQAISEWQTLGRSHKPRILIGAATCGRVAGALDVLAAAYAEAGRVPEAVKTATKALDLARQQQPSRAEGIGRRLELYKALKPYRQQP